MLEHYICLASALFKSFTSLHNKTISFNKNSILRLQKYFVISNF